MQTASWSPDRPSRGQAATGDALEPLGVSGCGLLLGKVHGCRNLTPSKGPLPARWPLPGPGLLFIKEIVSEGSQPGSLPCPTVPARVHPLVRAGLALGGWGTGLGANERAVPLLPAVLLGQLT